MTAQIAFSGGLESTYIAQMMLEQGENVDLYYGCITGMNPSPLEASLVYRCFEKLKEKFPNRTIRLYHVPNIFFGSHNGQIDVMRVNQAMRVAALLHEIQKNFIACVPMCGWTGEGTYEKSQNIGCYTTRQYNELKRLPVVLNEFTRLSPMPNEIITPLWGKTKTAVYYLIDKDLFECVVLNTVGMRVSETKIKEYENAGLKYPSYVDDVSKNPEKYINTYGEYFAGESYWRNKLSKEELFSPIPFSFLSPKANAESGVFVPVDNILDASERFWECLKIISKPTTASSAKTQLELIKSKGESK